MKLVAECLILRRIGDQLAVNQADGADKAIDLVIATLTNLTVYPGSSQPSQVIRQHWHDAFRSSHDADRERPLDHHDGVDAELVPSNTSQEALTANEKFAEDLAQRSIPSQTQSALGGSASSVKWHTSYRWSNPNASVSGPGRDGI